MPQEFDSCVKILVVDWVLFMNEIERDCQKRYTIIQLSSTLTKVSDAKKTQTYALLFHQVYIHDLL